MLRVPLIPAVADAAAAAAAAAASDTKRRADFFLLRGELAQARAQCARGEDTRAKACIPFVRVLLGGARNDYTDAHGGMRRSLM